MVAARAGTQPPPDGGAVHLSHQGTGLDVRSRATDGLPCGGPDHPRGRQSDDDCDRAIAGWALGPGITGAVIAAPPALPLWTDAASLTPTERETARRD